LSNATIGQHVRHIIELFQCLEAGYKTGIVNYEKRKRDVAIETNSIMAIELMQKLYDDIKMPDKPMQLIANYDEHSDEQIIIQTNYFRELVYNLEHAVHHMALIRVGLSVVGVHEVPHDFGVATSTIKYKNKCAQ
jgi:hypothetical protein